MEKLFDYMGYCSEPGYAEECEEVNFLKPEVYYCMSDGEPISDQIRQVKELNRYDVKDLRNLLNALFPGTFIYTQHLAVIPVILWRFMIKFNTQMT